MFILLSNVLTVTTICIAYLLKWVESPFTKIEVSMKFILVCHWFCEGTGRQVRVKWRPILSCSTGRSTNLLLCLHRFEIISTLITYGNYCSLLEEKPLSAMFLWWSNLCNANLCWFQTTAKLSIFHSTTLTLNLTSWFLLRPHNPAEPPWLFILSSKSLCYNMLNANVTRVMDC